MNHRWIEHYQEPVHPQSGDLMKGTGGIRKLRWSAQSKGKSGAVPLFLLTVFGKGEKANLSKVERNDLAKFTTLLLKNYGGSND